MTRYRAILAYDGTAYFGFQRQAGDIPTVQGAVEAAIVVISGQTATVIGAGRTDRGVHAAGQVIAFDLKWNHDDDDLLRALNANLSDDIALQSVVQQPGFHPRFDALSRIYRYTVIQAAQRQPLLRQRTWWVRQTLDVDAMRAAAGMLVGERDFAAFGSPPQGTNTVRTVQGSEWTWQPAYDGMCLSYRVEANAFLQHMVRRMVGLQVDVGRGVVDLAQFEDIICSADISRVKTIAPPQGLVLEAVRYADRVERSTQPVDTSVTSGW
jgi:tRNA pseudouridine38-40 synthase